MTTPNNSDKLSVLVFGAGAIGTYIGGSLIMKGNRVVFLERPDQAQILREYGIKLNLFGVEHPIKPSSIADSLSTALSLGPYDVAIFAVKAYHTDLAIQGFTGLESDIPPILCLQNGVANEPKLINALGSERVIYGTVTSAVGKHDTGNVVLERLRGIGIAQGHPLSKKLVHVFQDAGLNARLYPRPKDMKWSKMLTNLLANASSAILDMTPAEIFTHPRLCRLELEQLRESLRVMVAQGIRTTNLPGTPVNALAFAVQYLPPMISQQVLTRAVGAGRGSKMPSFHIDLYSGTGKSEVSYLNGAVVRAGKRAQIPTPINQLLESTLSDLTDGTIPIQMYQRQPEKFLALLP